MLSSFIFTVLAVTIAIVLADSKVCKGDATCTWSGRKLLIAGNWKMNTDLNSAVALTSGIVEQTKELSSEQVEVAIFPPFLFIRDVIKVRNIGCASSHLLSNPSTVLIFSTHFQVLEGSNPQGIRVGAQSVFFETKGAFTAAISAPMLQSVGAQLVLVGHSERRSVFGETDADINRSLQQVWAHGMVAVLCVGETLSEYELGTFHALPVRSSSAVNPSYTWHKALYAARTHKSRHDLTNSVLT